MKLRYLIPFLLAAPLMAQTCTTSVCNAATANQSDVLAALPSSGNTNATVVVNIPAGNAIWTGAPPTYTVPAAVSSLTIQGTTTVNCSGTPGTSGYTCPYIDNTVINDNSTTNTPILSINTTNATVLFRITGITLQPGTGPIVKSHGIFNFTGNTKNFRWDHSHMVITPADNSGPEFDGQIEGVLDHNYWDLGGNTTFDNGIRINTDLFDSVGLGDGGWMAATQFGSQHALFMESNYIVGGYTNDCNISGREVVRYNTFFNSQNSSGALHSVKDPEGDDRGCRSIEFYHNYMTGTPSSRAFAATGGEGAAVLEWGNTLGDLSVYVFWSGGTYRSETGQPEFCGFSSCLPPNGWAMCGTNQNYPGTPGTISTWDGNSSTATGYPCLDDLGRGQQADAMNGQAFPARANTTVGGQTWPHQYLEPMYFFMNTIPLGMSNEINIAAGSSAQSDRDFYYDCNSYNSPCSGGFTGAHGTGYGLHSARPATCTSGPGGTYGTSPTGSYGVGYFATDDNSGSGELWVCTATNTWTGIYEPAVYPHPLVSGTPTANAPTFSPSTGAPPQTVTMTCSTAGSIGCYTTNGSTPGAGTPGTCDGAPTITYSTPISVTVNPTTLNGICTKAAYLNSGVASSTYSGSSPVCGDPTQNGPNYSGAGPGPGGSYYPFPPFPIGFTSPTAGCVMHMTMDGSTPTCASAPYSTRLISLSTTMRVIACQGGYTSSSVVGGGWVVNPQKTRFSLSTTSASVNPVPFPQDNRMCCGTNVAALEATRGTYTLTPFHNFITQSIANGSTTWYTIQGFPTWMTGLGATESAPPTDLNVSAACQNVLTGTTTTDCSMKEFVTKLMEDRTGLSSQPGSPVNCPNLDYLEPINEFNTDSPSGSSTGWTGTYTDLATLANDISGVVHAWCSNTVVVGGSASAIVGFHSNGANGHFDVALETLLADWAGISGASLPDAVSFHAYPARGTVSPVPFPTSIVSNSDASCTSGNTPNVSCYIAVKDEATQIQGSAVLQNAAIVSWASAMPVYSTEGGFGTLSQLCSLTSGSTLCQGYVSEYILTLAAQNVPVAMLYAANDSTWGCYWNCGSGSSAWLQAFNQTSTWLAGHTITGTLTSTTTTGGNKWSLQLDSGAAEIDFCDAYLTSCTSSTTFNTQQDLTGATTTLAGSVTLTQSPLLLYTSTTTTHVSISGVKLSGSVGVQ